MKHVCYEVSNTTAKYLGIFESEEPLEAGAGYMRFGSQNYSIDKASMKHHKGLDYMLVVMKKVDNV